MPEDVIQESLKPLVFGNGALIKKQRPNLKWDKPDETLVLNTGYKSNAIRVVLIPKGKSTAAKTEGKAKDVDSAIEKERMLVL